ncbi:hypothetical protein [Tardiphaga sp.]|jgi:hypothetical protein|uniref:hypothetical protein n=1 Tax=Tardiphaga sp. TaxID=1926292 RepID=UPI0037D9A1E8
MSVNLQNTIRAVVLLLPLSLAACGGGPSGNVSFVESASGVQPFPTAYRTDLLAFMRTYLNDPVGVRGAMLTEPVQRSVGGNMRYVACVRYSAKDFNNRYTPVQERGVAFVDGRLERVVDNSAELCAGANYQPFPEMEKMTR